MTSLSELQTSLDRQSERLALALEVAGMGVWEFDPEAGRAQQDATVRELFGLPAGPVPLADVMDRVVPEDRGAVLDGVRAASRGGGDYAGAFRVHVPGRRGARWLRAIGRRAEADGRSLLIGVVRDVTEEERAQAQGELMLREMNHRVKNLFAVIGAMVGLAARSHATVGGLEADLRARIGALGRAHDITQNARGRDHVPLADLVRGVLEPYGADAAIEIDGPPVALPTRMVTPIGLILHEWASNASKFGGLSSGEGRLHVAWTVEPGDPRAVEHFMERNRGTRRWGRRGRARLRRAPGADVGAADRRAGRGRTDAGGF